MTRVLKTKVFFQMLPSLVLGLTLSGCMKAYVKSVGGNTEEVLTRIYRTDVNTAWQSVLNALKTSPLDISNRESGFIRTQWIDNTSHRNFIDSIGTGQRYLKAQYRFRVSVAKGFYQGKPSVKVAVQKEQLVKNDVLEGWRRIQTDAIDETTLLYRIGRLIFIQMKLAQIEQQKTQKAIEEFSFDE